MPSHSIKCKRCQLVDVELELPVVLRRVNAGAETIDAKECSDAQL